jgi:hypothetical protein
VLALGDGSNAGLDAMPAAIADQSWPAAGETEGLDALVRQRLRVALVPIREGLAKQEARKLAAAFLEESNALPPTRLTASPKQTSGRAGRYTSTCRVLHHLREAPLGNAPHVDRDYVTWARPGRLQSQRPKPENNG